MLELMLRACRRAGLGSGCARLVRGLCVALLCMVSAGCASRLKLTRLGTASHPPGNVAVFFAAQDAAGEPVADLHVSDIRIREDGQRLPAGSTGHSLADPGQITEHYTLLLVDLGSSAMAGDHRALVTAAMRELVERLGASHQVAVLAFDGASTLYEVVPFGASRAAALAALVKLYSLELRDPASNLHGAVLQGLAELDKAVRRATKPVRFATLVVLTDGVDRVHRVPARQVSDAVDATAHSVYTVGIGRDLDDAALARIGKTGYVRVGEGASAVAAFRELAYQIVRTTERYHLLTYCSELRDGQHVVEVTFDSPRGVGQLTFALEASGFRPGCDNRVLPSFNGTARERASQ